MEKQKDKELQKDVADKYQVLKGHGVGEYHWNGHIVHLERINLARADELVRAGFHYLVTKPANDEKKKPADITG